MLLWVQVAQRPASVGMSAIVTLGDPAEQPYPLALRLRCLVEHVEILAGEAECHGGRTLLSLPHL